jgi:hypothetical protein
METCSFALSHHNFTYLTKVSTAAAISEEAIGSAITELDIAKMTEIHDPRTACNSDIKFAAAQTGLHTLRKYVGASYQLTRNESKPTIAPALPSCARRK